MEVKVTQIVRLMSNDDLQGVYQPLPLQAGWVPSDATGTCAEALRVRPRYTDPLLKLLHSCVFPRKFLHSKTRLIWNTCPASQLNNESLRIRNQIVWQQNQSKNQI